MKLKTKLTAPERAVLQHMMLHEPVLFYDLKERDAAESLRIQGFVHYDREGWKVNWPKIEKFE